MPVIPTTVSPPTQTSSPTRDRCGLTPEQEAALTRYQELAEQACAETPQVPGQDPGALGTANHTRFEQLVIQEHLTNPKTFGATSYLGGRVINPGPGSAGSSRPDGVFGTTADAPEYFVDLKTQGATIKGWWMRCLTGNMQAAFKNLPVFQLHC